jgi:hypothetical protein
MSINVYKRAGIAEKAEWYDLASPDVIYIFPIANLPSRALAEVRIYSKNGTSTLIATGAFLNDSNTVLSSFTTFDTDTGSSSGYSEAIIPVPSGATRIRLGVAGGTAFAYVRPLDLSPFPPLTPIRYITSQSITVNNTSSFALLGGGAGGQGGGNHGGGGGSGYLLNGNVSPGTYTLTIGAAGNDRANGGGSSFAGSNASGGAISNSEPRAGGAGGSGGGGSTFNGQGGAGGFNGNAGQSGGFAGGSGSGVTANLFVPALAGGAGGTTTSGNSAGMGGGTYAGGGGGGSSNLGQVGRSANGSGGGGGGGSGGAAGGSGAAGAFWLLES